MKGYKTSISTKSVVFNIQWSYESQFPGLVGSGVSGRYESAVNEEQRSRNNSEH